MAALSQTKGNEIYMKAFSIAMTIMLAGAGWFCKTMYSEMQEIKQKMSDRGERLVRVEDKTDQVLQLLIEVRADIKEIKQTKDT